MKKVLSLAIIAGMFSVVACGPNKDEAAAKEKATQDSIRMADSLAKVAEEATKAAEMEKMKADSIAKADSLAKAAEAKTPAKKK